jgi:hypothetical protein
MHVATKQGSLLLRGQAVKDLAHGVTVDPLSSGCRQCAVLSQGLYLVSAAAGRGSGQAVGYVLVSSAAAPCCCSHHVPS